MYMNNYVVVAIFSLLRRVASDCSAYNWSIIKAAQAG